MGLVEPYEGDIYLNDGKLVNALYQEVQVNYVDTNPSIFKKDLNFNIALEFVEECSKKSHKIEEIIKLLNLGALSKKICKREPLFGGKISTGQAQRIGIARAMFNDSSEIYF